MPPWQRSLLTMPRRLSFADVFAAVFIFGVLYSFVRLGMGAMEPFSELSPPEISLDPAYLPYYAGRSLLRMFIAFGASIVFTLFYAYAAARSAAAERVLMPLLDILQSVPVLGFLSVTITGFMAMFPGRIAGPELASIFAIFTSQVWNITFSLYHSLITIPEELKEASDIYRLNWWQRMRRLELPYSMMALVWNGMMSFGGGWFFLAASEAITVLNKDIRLPGIGSYLALALEQQDVGAIGWAIAAMAVVIFAVDRIVWRPVVAWAQKYRLETKSAGEVPGSVFMTVMQRSALVDWIKARAVGPAAAAFNGAMSSFAAFTEEKLLPSPAVGRLRRAVPWIIGVGIALWLAGVLREAIPFMVHPEPPPWGHLLWLGFLTQLRVMGAVILGALWTVPAGVAIGMSPALSNRLQPVVQLAASFPANMLFPLVTILFLRFNTNFELGAVPLMMLGTQWYILFNVIAGAMAIPTDFVHAGSVFKLKGVSLWRRLILPAIFPHLVTGALTAAGGAWNASIVAEIIVWGDETLAATGLGAYITEATAAGHWPGIIGGTAVMSGYVVLLNRILWRPLYSLAEKKYRMG